MAKIETLIDLESVRQYLNSIGAEERSLRTAVVRVNHGKYWKDSAVIRFAKENGMVTAPPGFEPSVEQQAAISKEWAKVTFPELQLIKTIVNPHPEMKAAKSEHLFEFRNRDGMITMVQVRVTNKAGERAYIPFTYYDDKRWRKSEPDGLLPLYNAHLLKDVATVFVHEGAKAARHIQWMVDGKTSEARKVLADHPWGKELNHAAHLGWIGGAMSPERTDWSELTKAGVKRIYIVADNDGPGREAVPKIAKALRLPTFVVQFTDEFPASFDLADEFPKKMFSDDTIARFYTGPNFRSRVHPATWATDAVEVPGEGKRTKTIYVLRDSFKDMWAYVEEADVFVCKEMPNHIYNESVLNKSIAAFSHVMETSKMIVKSYAGKATKLCYMPAQPGRTVDYHGGTAINLHQPSPIAARAGDPAPFLEFMEYLIKSERERKEMLRWCATLVARPDIRMGYALLLISESQGVGKTTLASQILAPLVGIANVGWPGEMDIASAFNGWAANKRLIIISEVYAGASWKAYHTLKGVITDREITVNEKYQRTYLSENWSHLIACSNSMRALKVEQDDRRWFYPTMTEKPWPGPKFQALRRWLDGGGLNIVRHWADNYGDYVQPFERAPLTDAKRELIEGSLSEAQREAKAIAEATMHLERPAALAMSNVIQWVQNNVQGKVFDSDYELRRAMGRSEMKQYAKRLKIGPRMEYVMMNSRLEEAVKALVGGDNDRNQLVRGNIINVQEIMEAMM